MKDTAGEREGEREGAGGRGLRGPVPMRCGVCGDRIEVSPLRCHRCRAAHHHDCWEYNGGCAIFGCSPPMALVALGELPGARVDLEPAPASRLAGRFFHALSNVRSGTWLMAGVTLAGSALALLASASGCGSPELAALVLGCGILALCLATGLGLGAWVLPDTFTSCALARRVRAGAHPGGWRLAGSHKGKPKWKE